MISVILMGIISTMLSGLIIYTYIRANRWDLALVDVVVFGLAIYIMMQFSSMGTQATIYGVGLGVSLTIKLIIWLSIHFPKK